MYFIVADKINLNEYNTIKLIIANTPTTNLEIELNLKLQLRQKAKYYPIKTTVKYSTKVMEYIFILPTLPRFALFKK